MLLSTTLPSCDARPASHLTPCKCVQTGPYLRYPVFLPPLGQAEHFLVAASPPTFVALMESGSQVPGISLLPLLLSRHRIRIRIRLHPMIRIRHTSSWPPRSSNSSLRLLGAVPCVHTNGKGKGKLERHGTSLPVQPAEQQGWR
jgi:hypothetical protein